MLKSDDKEPFKKVSKTKILAKSSMSIENILNGNLQIFN